MVNNECPHQRTDPVFLSLRFYKSLICHHYLVNGIHNNNTRFCVLVGQKAVGKLDQRIKVTHNITLKHLKHNKVEFQKRFLSTLFSVALKFWAAHFGDWSAANNNNDLRSWRPQYITPPTWRPLIQDMTPLLLRYNAPKTWVKNLSVMRVRL